MNELQNVLESVRNGIASLKLSMERWVVLSLFLFSRIDINVTKSRLKSKVNQPYEQCKLYTTQIERIQVVADLLRRIIRFQQLVKRLELEYSKEDSRDLTKLALTLHELGIYLRNF